MKEKSQKVIALNIKWVGHLGTVGFFTLSDENGNMSAK